MVLVQLLDQIDLFALRVALHFRVGDVGQFAGAGEIRRAS
jgi:hypothetical protein